MNFVSCFVASLVTLSLCLVLGANALLEPQVLPGEQQLSPNGNLLGVFQNRKKRSLMPTHFFNGCGHPWVLVGRSCLFTDMSSNTTWQGGRSFCKRMHQGGDLATFEDANEFAMVLSHLRTINSLNKKIHFWIGGSDLQQTDEWLWITGKPMPRGSPFWGVAGGGGYEPNSNSEHCTILYSTNRYYVHNWLCNSAANWLVTPLCQYSPI